MPTPASAGSSSRLLQSVESSANEEIREISETINRSPTTTELPATWKKLLAFALIYLVWGSTFLAIRVGVRQIPPFLFAAVRFTSAGLLLCVWTRLRGMPLPSRREWISLSILALMIFVGDYGLLFWAEQRVPSGAAAIVMATIPAFMSLTEIVLLRTQRLTLQLALALLLGFCGVAALMSPSMRLGNSAAIDRPGAAALLFGSLSWSIAAALSRKLPLPASKMVSAGAQMLLGGLLLTLLSGLLGEFRRFDPLLITQGAWLSLLYLIVAGSLIAFTAYVWLIHHESPTRVGTYAYVNPIVAVLLGYFVLAEPLNRRMVSGSLFVLISVAVITTTPGKSRTVTTADHRC